MASPDDAHLLPAAIRFLELEGGRTPDFSACVVLVPHHHAAQDFRRALRQALTDPFLLPPRLLTLPELAREAALSIGTEADSRRLAELHDFLRRTGHLPEAGLWPAAQELHGLLEELDMADCALDQAHVSQALHANDGNAYLGLEASIAQAVWHAFKQAAPGKVRAYGTRLSWLANQASQTLYALGLVGLGRQEEAFFQAWQERHPVHLLPCPAPFDGRHALLNAVWREASPPLARRAEVFAVTHPTSPLHPDISIHPAHNLETSARMAEHILLTWLGEGRRRIALLALDRLLARRLRALLERRHILVQDETGWAFSTSAVSHVLERWLGLAGGRIWHKDLLDLLKSPFLFADTQAIRVQTVHGLEKALRRHGAPVDLAGYQALARQEGLEVALPLLHRLQTAKALFTPRRLPLHDWTHNLLVSLKHLGADQALARDPIGQQLLDLLIRLERETSEFSQRFGLADWRRWLFLHLEQATFSDASVESPIRLTHLAAAHHRDLEGILILGAGANHLPGRQKTTVFNNATRLQLGLPDTASQEKTTQDVLLDLLSRAPRAAFIWQAEADGDPAPLSPWLLHLEAFHQAAWGISLMQEISIDHGLPPGDGKPVEVAPRAPQPPARLSVSAWQSLVACPYQFFARHVLGLNEQDEMPEEMDKAEYGSLVHRILARFHTSHPTLAGTAPGIWETHLNELTTAIFAPVEARDFQATAWRLRWERHIPAYVAWALEYEAAGWRFQSAETPLEKAVSWGESSQTLLYGRADRLDRKAGEPADSLAVLDYKTQARQTLKAKLDPAGEDVQLAAYAWLADAAEAGFVAVDEKKVALMRAEGGEALAERAETEAGRIAQTLAHLAAGQGLPAHGAPGTCAWCEMQGLCRRAHKEVAVP
jgi:ATP-dependent helicase/nuclease subunit B